MSTMPAEGVEMANSERIYYVEDDEHIRDLTAYALQRTGYEVRAFPDGEGFVALCAAEPPDAVLLDIMLPGDDGLELLKQLRENDATAHLPVMMLTAKGTEFDTVCGLDAGADDYLAKPFGMMELISRVNALLRRADRAVAAAKKEAREPKAEKSAADQNASPDASGGAATIEEPVLESGGIRLSPAAHSVKVAGQRIPLTVKEFDLLRTLMENEGRVLTRDQLLARVWDIHFAGGTRTVDAHVKTLRQKLAEAAPGSEARVATVRGVGYVFQGDEA